VPHDQEGSLDVLERGGRSILAGTVLGLLDGTIICRGRAYRLSVEASVPLAVGGR